MARLWVRLRPQPEEGTWRWLAGGPDAAAPDAVWALCGGAAGRRGLSGVSAFALVLATPGGALIAVAAG
eukprot:8912609-Lingulodinium_polyedra.AAC.1